MVYAEFVAGVDGEIVVLDDAYALNSLSGLGDYVHPLVHIEEAALVLVDADGDYHFVEHCQSSF